MLRSPGVSIYVLVFGRICVSGHLNPNPPGVYKAMKLQHLIQLCFRQKEGQRWPPFCGAKARQVPVHPPETGGVMGS